MECHRLTKPLSIGQIYHNAPFGNKNVHNFLLQNGALWDMGLVHCESCATGLLIIGA